MIDPERKAAIRETARKILENPDIDGRPKTGPYGDDPLLDALARAHSERFKPYDTIAEREMDLGTKLDRLIDSYDATDDFARSIDESYREIRERMANGGPPWTPPK